MIMENFQGYRFTSAVVAFGGQPTFWWMHFLKPGFYHCLVALKSQNEWLLIDPLLHYIDIVYVFQGDIHLFFRQHGYTMVDVSIQEPSAKHMHIWPVTCVETVKRIIGVHKLSVFTPFKLFRYLAKKIQTSS